MGTRATIIYKTSDNTGIRVYDIQSDGNIENIGPQLLNLNSSSNVKLYFEHSDGVRNISEQDYITLMHTYSPYAVYCFDEANSEWMVYECGEKMSLNSKMLQVVTSQMNDVRKDIQSLTNKAASLQNIINSLILTINSRDSHPVNRDEPEIYKD